MMGHWKKKFDYVFVFSLMFKIQYQYFLFIIYYKRIFLYRSEFGIYLWSRSFIRRFDFNPL